jgi:hypothetical protein
MPDEEEKAIAAAVGSAAASKSGAQSVEQAMANAVMEAMKNGITDQDELRRLQLEARNKALGKK